MKRPVIFVWMLVVIILVSGSIAAVVVQERKPRAIKRVKRPHFTKRDWDGVYFEDLFRDGLVGDRPLPTVPGAKPNESPGATDQGDPDVGPGGLAWSTFISRSTIEDEVKSLQTRLNQEVTTPVKFKSDYAKVHQSFSMLSMLFGVIREYDDEIRWKKFAGSAQMSFERAAANSRVGTIQAYESCKRRKEELQDLVRGGNFPGDVKLVERLDWSEVVGRAPLMERLQVAHDELKLLTANKGQFTKNVEDVFHESQMVAAMAQALLRESMEGADDEGYVEFAKGMSDSALSVSRACGTEDYESAADAVNLMGQSCSNCHDEWR